LDRGDDHEELVMAASPTQYPIRAVARMTGISIDTLRAWERRYQAVTPVRDDRGRVYTDAHVARLKRLAALVEGGHAIGRIAALSDDELQRIELGSRAETAAAPAVDLAPLLDAMQRYDLPTVEAQLNRHALLLQPQELIFSVVLPALRSVGDRWQAGAIRPAHEHLVSSVIRSVLGSLMRTMPRGAQAKKLVLASPSGERHELGLLSAGVLAAAAGVDVIYLGPDLPAADIVHVAVTAKADVVLIAVTIANAVNQRDLRQLSQLPDAIEIWCGGPQSAAVRDAIGPRVRSIARLEHFSELLH
jgi:DNA-binding transcriptional MerR regulator